MPARDGVRCVRERARGSAEVRRRRVGMACGFAWERTSENVECTSSSSARRKGRPVTALQGRTL
eukprot:scaffold69177_cov62-Phaeocystis_antarctica.AAC.2